MRVEAPQARQALQFDPEPINLPHADAGDYNRHHGRHGHCRQDHVLKHPRPNGERAQNQAELRDLVHEHAEHERRVALDPGRVPQRREQGHGRDDREERQEEANRERVEHGLAQLQRQTQRDEENRHAQGLDRLHLRLDVHLVRQLGEGHAREEGRDLSREARRDANRREARGVPEGSQVQELEGAGEHGEEPVEDEPFEEEADGHGGEELPE
mmetsp:Transcript_27581/g.62770  ORF Transcript_27581/g.62770 Transcript_27581/m.62770 type:complete len:213 (-) Transcript_27581:1088-1726(-)